MIGIYEKNSSENLEFNANVFFLNFFVRFKFAGSS
jgi:hypothetical protein